MILEKVIGLSSFIHALSNDFVTKGSSRTDYWPVQFHHTKVLVFIFLLLTSSVIITKHGSRSCNYIIIKVLFQNWILPYSVALWQRSVLEFKYAVFRVIRTMPGSWNRPSSVITAKSDSANGFVLFNKIIRKAQCNHWLMPCLGLL